MAKYRAISLNFWTDAKIIDDFTPEDRYFYLYLFTNPHTNLAGCYEISIRQMVNETGYSKDTIERLIARFTNIHKVIDYSEETKEILLVNWHKYNWTVSEKFRKPLIDEINVIKNDVFRGYLVSIINGNEIPYRYRIDTPCIDTTVSVSVSDNVSVSDIKDIDDNINIINKTKKRSNVFVPPTLDEVIAYCNERNNGIDPETFIDFYESKGWMVGKNKMKDWKAAIRTWEKHEGQKKQGGGSAYMDAIKNRVSQVDDWV